MRVLVSMTGTGDMTRLRRYQQQDRRVVCTHDGSYQPEGVTPINVGYYVDSGAPQDRLAPRRDYPGARRGGSPSAA